MRRLVASIAVGLLGPVGPGAAPAAAVPLVPGDLVVVDQNCCGGGQGGVIRVTPTGAQTVVASGGNFVDPRRIAIGPTGDLFVADVACRTGGNGGVIRVNPATGAQMLVASSGNFVDPNGITIGPTGDLFVTDANCCGGGQGGVIRVNPVTGAQTVVASGGNFVDLSGITIGPTGDLFVSDGNCCAGGNGGVIRVNPATGAQTVVASGGNFNDPRGIAVGLTGDLFIADGGSFGAGVGRVIRVTPATGEQTVVASSGNFVSPLGVAVVPPRRAILTGAGAGGGPHVRLLDAATGAPLVEFFPYVPAFTGGVRVAAGDVNGDGVPEVITAPGPGGGPHVQVFDGRALLEGRLVTLRSFFAYAPGFTGGVVVGAADLTGDGRADILTGAGPGGGPHVQAFDGATGALVAGPLGSFFAYDPAFTGGIFVAGFR
jgi:hypothetical protein